ncbi:FMN-binding negative transcriptional regulator [Acidicapsa dinghuensis]|uniref:FMN-binding negative transcriptional regulator n=1 Tax=Acidicapsa dinghuensis TaxID=2218256 RepID=A0ABW1ENE5_9BACT|nr:FMN-binding negative transcriptional regulator [Acidicapsa dinghuensis]
MYIPKFNEVTNRGILIEAMKTWPFATLFGPDENGQPTATHLPLVVLDEGVHGVLEGHFAKANSHWKGLVGRETLVVFSGPHSYVSPSLYVERKSVPTWNYIAVHAYGKLRIVGDTDTDLPDDFATKDALLKRLIAIHEPAYAAQWSELPESYRTGMLRGIVGFHIEIERIEGKFKLSQNRPEEDRQNVYVAHRAGDLSQKELADWMRRLIPRLE